MVVFFYSTPVTSGKGRGDGKKLRSQRNPRLPHTPRAIQPLVGPLPGGEGNVQQIDHAPVRSQESISCVRDSRRIARVRGRTVRADGAPPLAGLAPPWPVTAKVRPPTQRREGAKKIRCIYKAKSRCHSSKKLFFATWRLASLREKPILKSRLSQLRRMATGKPIPNSSSLIKSALFATIWLEKNTGDVNSLSTAMLDTAISSQPDAARLFSGGEAGYLAGDTFPKP